MSSPIPQPPGVPLLGNIFDVDPSNTWGSLKKLADKYGPIFKINALGQQIVFIGSASLLEEICDERRFRKCVTGPVVEIRHAVHDSLFTAFHNEPSWGIAHRIMAPLLSQAAVETNFHQMLETTSDLIAKWTRSSSGSRIDVMDDLRRLNLQATTLCFFNQRSNFIDGPEPPMIKAMDGATLEAMKRPVRPKLLNWLLFQRRFNNDTRTMRDFAAKIVAQGKSRETSKEDMLNALLHGQDPETGESLDPERVIDEIINIYIGGATSPCFVSFALYYLVKNPEVVTKARQEIEDIVGHSGQITPADLSRFKYIEAILREAMRLSAVAPGFNIEPVPSPDTPDPVSLAGGKYEIPKTQAIIVILSAVNRDPAIFDEPEAFRPERMLGDAFEKLPSGVKKGFGNGKRECIGKVYAWQWSMITLISILKDVHLEMADPSYELEVNGAFCVQPLQLFLTTALHPKSI